jgi:hypothetical protein
MNSAEQEAKSFEDFVNAVLEDGDKVYVSPWMGEDRTESVLGNEKIEEAVMARSEGLAADNFGDREDVEVIDSVKDYLANRYGDSSGFDGEFLAPPANYAGAIRDSPERARELIKTWAEQSNEAVNQGGFTLYLDSGWEDPRTAPFRKADFDIGAEDLNADTRFILMDYFDRVEEVEGEDYSGVLARRR